MNNTISVVGLGKLGASMVAGFAEVGFDVIGYDISKRNVNLLNNGLSPVEETDLNIYIEKNKSRIKATSDLKKAIFESDISFVVIPTPSNDDGAFSSKSALLAFEAMGKALKEKSDYHLFVMTSTVLPGITRNLLIPAIEKASDKRCGVEFGVCYNPEFIALGSVIRDFLNPDFYLLGEFDSRSGDILAKVHTKVSQNNAPIKRMTIENAELAKIALNSYVTMKISFANILADLCMKIPGGDVDEVSSALGMDSRIGRKYLTGGMGFAGPCFPRDNVALNYFGEKVGADTNLLIQNHNYNERLNSQIFHNLLSFLNNCKYISILGLSYKPKSFLVDNSPGLSLANLLGEKGYVVKCFDPMANNESKTKLIDEVEVCDSAEEALRDADAIFITTPDDNFIRPLEETNKDVIVVDLWRYIDPSLSSQFKKYIGYGVCQDDDQYSEKLQDIWRAYE